MKMLFLDDNEKRIKHVQKQFKSVQPTPSISYLHIARTAEEAIELLQENEYDFISLDHDLGENRLTGMEVVEWMIEQQRLKITGFVAPPWNGVVRIHSWNIPAGKRMVEKLENWYFHIYLEPFAV